MRRRSSWVLLIAAALAAAVAPISQMFVERRYSNGFYPHLQHVLTSLSNLAPFSLFDVLCLALIAAFAVACYRAVRNRGWNRGALFVVWILLRGAAVLYLLFLATWGLNYRRVPLEDKLAFDQHRVTREGGEALVARTVASLNRLYADAHRAPTPLDALADAFQSADAALGARVPIVPARPKETLLGGYFHQAAISGMTDPFLLETLLSPDLLTVERPFVIAHEWGHLAGYADESEASYVGWLACQRSDAAAQYSAWLALLGSLEPFLSRAHSLRDLGAGPRIDLAAMRYRYERTSPMIRAAARETYDGYLKANRVEAGVASYDLVVQLILGTELDGQGNPRRR
jgi:hypothetical protein